METNRPSNTLAIIGLVLGSIAILFSFIPCIGTIAFIPGIVGAILGVIAYLKAKDNGHPKGLSIAAIAVSVLACAISVFQIYAFQSMTSNMKSNLKEYTSCEDLEADYKSATDEMITLTKEMEDGSPSFSSIKNVTMIGVKLDHIQKQSDKLGCNINIEDFDPSESVEEEESEAEGEGNEEESGASEGEGE